MDMDYYSVAKQASQDFVCHPAYPRFKLLASRAKKILDAGCGEGSRLNLLAPPRVQAYGLDINKQAIRLAQRQFPRLNFIPYGGHVFPLPNASFDFVYSAFVLEHTQDPQQFIDEMIRVLAPGGQLAIICPNFGAPNRRSPCSVESPIKKLLVGIWLDSFLSADTLHWQQVVPKPDYNQIDDDTTVEPYLRSLQQYLDRSGMRVIHASSLWSLEEKTRNPRKLLFKWLGQLSLPPFSHWGPQLFIIAVKADSRHGKVTA